MFSEKSIKRKFLIQLVTASSVLIVIFSVILYYYIKIQVYDDVSANLKKEAAAYARSYRSRMPFSGTNRTPQSVMPMQVETVIRVDKKSEPFFEQYEKNGKRYITIFYPYNSARSSFIKLERDISGTETLLTKIKHSIIALGFVTSK